MELDIRYSNHPKDVEKYNTEQLRDHFLISNLFENDLVKLTYSHNDRIIVGGIMPQFNTLTLTGGKELGVDYFFERREAGIINIGDKGIIILDGEEYILEQFDGLYVGMGVKEISFKSVCSDNPAKFYLNSCPAHKSYPNTVITLAKANKVNLGNQENLNKRTINQYVHPAVCQSCQLVMGMTILDSNNVWNTMPCHTHERRMEVYLYFNFPENARVFHLMGQPSETRHIVIKNEEAIISPSWSIHSGVGTTSYTFIWGMCGENQTFTDMDHVNINDLK